MRRLASAAVIASALAAGMVARADETPPHGAVQTPPEGAKSVPQGDVQTPPSPSAAQTPPPPSVAQTPSPPGVVETPTPPSAAQTPPPAAVETPAPQSAVQSVPAEAAEAILGQPVTDPDGKDIGRLVDVLVDANGQPQAGVIDFGGFMGVGNRKVAVHWSALHFNPGDLKHKVTLDMTPDQIKAAPEFLNANKAASVVTPASTAPTSP